MRLCQLAAFAIITAVTFLALRQESTFVQQSIDKKKACGMRGVPLCVMLKGWEFQYAVAAVCVLAALLTGCSRDPNVRKQKYLESGQRYFDKGQYREAAIQSRTRFRLIRVSPTPTTSWRRPR